MYKESLHSILMMPTALVPVRMAPVPKRRLAHVASAADRARLVRELFAHVIGVLSEAGLDVVVLAPHPLTLDGVSVWRDERPGLNAALTAAIGRTGVPVLIVHADLPALAVADVDALIDRPGDVVIGRAADGGTNALLLRSFLRPSFGRDSALAHARLARSRGLRAAVIDRPGLAVDVDDEAALTAWRGDASRQRRS